MSNEELLHKKFKKIAVSLPHNTISSLWLMRTFLLIFFCISLKALQAQDEYVAHSDSAYLHTAQILAQLVRATGNIDPNISLEMPLTTGKIAAVVSRNHKILLEKWAYNVCMQLPSDKQDAAIAFILGHELAHIYRFHHQDYAVWVEHFIQYKELTEDERKIESQADEYGFFYARIAGYSTTGIEEVLFTRLYDYLEAAQKVGIQPPKEGRIQMAKDNSRKIQPYIDLFRLAEKMMVLEEYSIAAALYEHILPRLTSPEMYLNTAVAQMLYAKSIRSKSKIVYTFPLLFDAESQYERGEKYPYDRQKEVPIILQSADSLLQIAAQQYAPYPQAHLYLAYTHYLQSLENEVFLSKIEPDLAAITFMKCDSSLRVYKRFLQAVLFAALGKNKETHIIFNEKEMIANFPAEVAENIFLIDSQKPYPIPVCKTEKNVGDEKINGVYDIPKEVMKEVISDTIYNRWEKRMMTIRSKNIPAVCHYYQVEIDSLQKIEIIETEKGYSQKTATGLGINDRAQSLERAYGIPCCKIKLPTLQFYRYNAYRDIVFRLKEGNIVGWYLYKK